MDKHKEVKQNQRENIRHKDRWVEEDRRKNEQKNEGWSRWREMKWEEEGNGRIERLFFIVWF